MVVAYNIIIITDRSSLSENKKGYLISQQPFTYLNYRHEQEWIPVDVKQADKYTSRN